MRLSLRFQSVGLVANDQSLFRYTVTKLLVISVLAMASPALAQRTDSPLSFSRNPDGVTPAQAVELASLGLGLQDPRESGIVVTLPPGAYTVVIAGKDLASGIGLVEVYDADPAASRLANISTRGFVETGDNVMIGGFILGA